jgi:hypothetical protein
MPLLSFIGKLGVFTGTTLSFIIRCGVLLGLVTAIAYVLEKLLQPRIKQYFKPVVKQGNTNMVEVKSDVG